MLLIKCECDQHNHKFLRHSCACLMPTPSNTIILALKVKQTIEENMKKHIPLCKIAAATASSRMEN